MKKLSLLLAMGFMMFAVASIQSCKSSSQASGSKMFKFNLENGKGYDYEMVFDLQTKVGPQTINMTVGGEYSMNITGTEGDVKSVATSYKSMRMNMQAGGMNIDIDSDKPLAEDGNGKDPLQMMNRVFKGLVGKQFIIKVDESGKVLEVTGFDKILTGMVDSMGMEDNMKMQIEASLKDQFNNESIKDQFAQVFTIFPNKEIKVGDSWEKSYSTTGKMGATFTTTYTAKEIEGDHITLASKTKITSKEGGEEISGDQTGNIIVDSKTGLMINAEFDQNMEVNAQGQKVQVTGKGKIKGKAN